VSVDELVTFSSPGVFDLPITDLLMPPELVFEGALKELVESYYQAMEDRLRAEVASDKAREAEHEGFMRIAAYLTEAREQGLETPRLPDLMMTAAEEHEAFYRAQDAYYEEARQRLAAKLSSSADKAKEAPRGKRQAKA
jgi:hypothetical protein